VLDLDGQGCCSWAASVHSLDGEGGLLRTAASRRAFPDANPWYAMSTRTWCPLASSASESSSHCGGGGRGDRGS
jgi:hypothetical protein